MNKRALRPSFVFISAQSRLVMRTGTPVRRIWHDQAYYADLCRTVEDEARKHDIEQSVDRFVTAIANEAVTNFSNHPTPLMELARVEAAEL